MAYLWIRFVYKGADSKWIYVQIDDRRNDFYKEWDLRDASYTYDDYFKTSECYYCKNQNELKEDFMKYFEKHLEDSLYKATTTFHPERSNWGSCYEIAWYVNCINSAKKDIDMNSLIEWWNNYKAVFHAQNKKSLEI